MSFVRKDDLSKVAKLGVAIAAVFGCAAWRVAGAMAPPPSAPKTESVSGSGTLAPDPAPSPSGSAASAQTVSISTPSVSSGSASSGPAKKDDLVDAPPMLVGVGIDPFRTIRREVGSAPVPMGAGPMNAAPTGALAPLPPTGSLAALPATKLPAAALVPAAGTTLHVVGIVAGPHATAVLEIGNVQRVVRVGQRLDDGATVARIEPTTVVLHRSTGETSLVVGE